MTCLLRNVDHVDRAESSSEQRLVSVAPCRVHDQYTRVLADGLCESFRTLLDNNVTPAAFAGECSIHGRPIFVRRVLELGNDDLVGETWFTLINDIELSMLNHEEKNPEGLLAVP